MRSGVMINGIYKSGRFRFCVDHADSNFRTVGLLVMSLNMDLRIYSNHGQEIITIVYYMKIKK